MKLEKKISLNRKKYPVGCKLELNPVHQTHYFKLENLKIPVQIDKELSHLTCDLSQAENKCCYRLSKCTK
jgi:hypothetical protein